MLVFTIVSVLIAMLRSKHWSIYEREIYLRAGAVPRQGGNRAVEQRTAKHDV
jgi:hypothetical protein